eukprot:gene12546-6367_t
MHNKKVSRKTKLKLLSKDGLKIKNYPELLHDEYAIRVAIQQNPSAYKLLSIETQSQFTHVKYLMKLDISKSSWIPSTFFDNPLNVFNLFKIHPCSYYRLPKTVQQDSWIVFCFKRFTGYKKLKMFDYDKEIVLRASKLDSISLNTFIGSKYLLEDCSILVNGIINRWIGFHTIREYTKALDNEDFGVALMHSSLSYCSSKLSKRLLSDKKFIFRCLHECKFSGMLFYWIEESLKNDLDFAKKCVLLNGTCYEYFNSKLQRNRELSYLAIEKSYTNLKICPYRFDKEFLKYALHLNNGIFNCIEKKMMDDEFIRIYYGIKLTLKDEKIVRFCDICWIFK